MEGIEQGQEALELFSLYAETLEKQSGSYACVALHLYSDGSGLIQRTDTHEDILAFSGLDELIAQCKKELG